MKNPTARPVSEPTVGRTLEVTPNDSNRNEIMYARLRLWTATVAALLAVAGASPAQELPPDSLAGAWTGTLETGAGDLEIVLRFEASGEDGLTATLDSPDQGAYGIGAGPVRLDGDSVEVPVPAIGGRFEGTYRSAGTGPEIRGTWSQGGTSLPLVLTPASGEEAAAEPERPQEPEEPLPYVSRDVAFRNEADGIELAGTFTRPRGEGPFPAVALISGSGPQDRDESVAGHRPFLVLSDHLTRRGIAVLRYDDRGTGKSGGDFGEADSRGFARDAGAAVRWLAARDEVDSGRIGLVGHSEGGLIAPLVSRRDDEVDFLVLLAGPALPGDELLHLQAEVLIRAGGASEETLRETHRTQERLFRAVLEEDDREVRRRRIRRILTGGADADSVEAGERATPADAADQGVEAQVRQLSAPWFRFFLRHDPAPVLERVEVPVLALFGEKDLQVPADTNMAVMRRALETAPTGEYRIVELEGLNHLFQNAETGLPAEYPRIEQTMAPEAMEAVADWVLGPATSGTR